mgnify:CR=1 FL=1
MRQFVQRARCHTANSVGVMLQTMYAPMGWVPFAVWSTIRVALGASIATTSIHDGLERGLINPLLSPNWNGNVSAPQLPYLCNGYRHIKWPTIYTQPLLTLMVGNSTERDRPHNSFSYFHFYLIFSMSEGCSVCTKNVSIINAILESLFFPVPYYCSGKSHAFHFPCNFLLLHSCISGHTLFGLDQ